MALAVSRMAVCTSGAYRMKEQHFWQTSQQHAPNEATRIRYANYKYSYTGVVQLPAAPGPSKRLQLCQPLVALQQQIGLSDTPKGTGSTASTWPVAHTAFFASPDLSSIFTVVMAPAEVLLSTCLLIPLLASTSAGTRVQRSCTASPSEGPS
ncbi:unnamed protein product [Rangifer tarandus platyrhynchus]|uniref:Uncharacterized protein n=1 Tax=Rangifer tarandus platyrhynchus TaxID=3082113 RepID=A0ABN8XK97_RANTA|nr:unnamed protein product [Rangifer tarandus platyrhynchus]